MLNVSRNQLTALPESVGQLSQLQGLSVSENRLTALPESVGQLSQLQQLYISGNQLTALPESVRQLSQLQRLEVSENRLTALPESVGQLSQLQELHVSGNRLTALPENVGQLSQLHELYVFRNRLTALPENVGQLSQLQELHVSANRLTALPEIVGQLNQLRQLFLHDNPGLEIPPEVLGPTFVEVGRDRAQPAAPASILAYYFNSRTSRPLNEAKMILVGRGGVGKTSLIQRLVRNTFNPREKKTDGIAITPWRVTVRGDQVRLNIWDFGGQEIMHATHQFFMTKRSLYLLVLNAREGEQDANLEYWLRLVESFGGDSPVIIVTNQIKQLQLDLNRRGLQEKFPFIRDFIQTDCEADLGLDILRRAIERETDRLDHLRDPFPASWFTVKQRLAHLKENYITYDQYQHLCTDHAVTEKVGQDTLVKFLHDLGIVVNFHDDPRLADTHVLNPEWVTNGIYKILNAESLAKKKNGELHLKVLSSLLEQKTYPQHMHRFLLDLMGKFELCYEFYGSNGEYLVPELLGKEEPALPQFAGTDALRFDYHYNILPEGLVPRFIVRSRVLNKDLPRWRTGAQLAFEGNQALVKADVQDRKVSIAVIGNPTGRRRLLSVIRSDFEDIHRSIARLQAQEKVPVPQYPGVVVDYETLRVLEEEQEGEFPLVVNGKLVKLNVAELLNGIEETPARRREAERETIGGKGPVRVVFSYAHINEELRDRLGVYLKSLERQQLISMWYDRKIMPGDKWKDVIDDNFQRADLILLLVSADFIGSDYCYEIELETALARDTKGEARVIPVILEACPWENLPFGALQALPKGGKPVTSWPNQSEAWNDVAEGIKKVAEAIRSRRR